MERNDWEAKITYCYKEANKVVDKSKKQKFISYVRYKIQERSPKIIEERQKEKNKSKKMEHKQYNLEKLPNMYDKEQISEKLNKIMDAMVDK